MTGRGIDQILPHPSPPQLHEPNVASACEYVELAERVHGRIHRPLDYSYIWGDLLAELDRLHPAARIINLETAVTSSEDACSGKSIHYRMNPRNLPCLKVAGVDCCVLANNHTMDWGRDGLQETSAPPCNGWANASTLSDVREVFVVYGHCDSAPDVDTVIAVVRHFRARSEPADR
jgi:poly-gamma-glutamate synthesis protein (capsule biosynthesis protein)